MRPRMIRWIPFLLVTLVTGTAMVWLTPGLAQPEGSAAGKGERADPRAVERGRELFQQGCSSCHGFNARGVRDRGPSLRGTGSLATDFYLRTGRMPLGYPGEEPSRAEPRYSNRQIEDIVAYVASFGGPEIPVVDPGAGSLSEGQRLFAASCAGCHAITGAGGVATGASAPPLARSSPTQIAEAARIGPYLMPRFNRRLLDPGEVDSLARYVEYTQDPEDAGGWGIGHIGPVPEGMVAWLLAAAALLVIAWVIGERQRARS